MAPLSDDFRVSGFPGRPFLSATGGLLFRIPGEKKSGPVPSEECLDFHRSRRKRDLEEPYALLPRGLNFEGDAPRAAMKTVSLLGES